uniref:AT-hook motif nuclear-localized protein n=1 Tax=Panagrellus redivivus TaxID=6233 RepID=A0A7E4W7K3_PANRE
MAGHRGKVSKPPATKQPAYFPPPPTTKKPAQPPATPKRGPGRPRKNKVIDPASPELRPSKRRKVSAEPMDLSSSMSSIDIDDPAAVVNLCKGFLSQPEGAIATNLRTVADRCGLFDRYILL